MGAIETLDVTKQVADYFKNPAWLATGRQKALEAYQAAETPDRVAHLWRYTDPAQFFWSGQDIIPAEPAGRGEMASAATDLLLAGGHDATLVIGRSGVAHIALDPAAAAKGVVLASLHEAAQTHRPLIEKHLGAAVPESHGKLEALNAALWQAGAFLYVPRGVTLEKPVHIVIAAEETDSLLAARILVIVEESARATVVVEYVSPRAAPIIVNGVTEVFAGANSNVRHVTVQRLGEKTSAVLTQRAHVSRDANLLNIWASLGSKVTKADLGVTLTGENAHANLLGVAFAQKRQHFDHHTVHRHQSGHTFSNLNFKVVLKDKARSAYTGLIRIEDNARFCEAYQENRNLQLSEGPRADSIPELEILNDEVKCTHGATIGPISQEEIFYLTARGIHRSDAVRLIVGGFVEPTLNEIPEDIRERLRAYIIERLKEI